MNEKRGCNMKLHHEHHQERVVPLLYSQLVHPILKSLYELR